MFVNKYVLNLPSLFADCKFILSFLRWSQVLKLTLEHVICNPWFDII